VRGAAGGAGFGAGESGRWGRDGSGDAQVIDRNQAIPARKSKVFTTEVDNQANVFLQIYQGERQFVKDNSRLGGFTLGNIPPAPRGVPQIEVSFHIDANGILFVTAQDLGTKKKESLTITNSMGRLSDDEIDRMIRDAKKYAESDRKAKVRLEARQGLTGLMRSIEAAMKDEVGRAMDDADKAEVREAIDNTRKWLRSKEGKAADADDLAERQANIERLWKPLVTRAYQEGGGGGEDRSGGGGGGGEDGEGGDREDRGPDEL
jgi:molecular chaperone DnaK (HSP70)